MHTSERRLRRYGMAVCSVYEPETPLTLVTTSLRYKRLDPCPCHNSLMTACVHSDPGPLSHWSVNKVRRNWAATATPQPAPNNETAMRRLQAEPPIKIPLYPYYLVARSLRELFNINTIIKLDL